MNAQVQNLSDMKSGQGKHRPVSEMKPKEQVAYLLNSKKAEIAKMLPQHLNIERLLKVAQIAATTTPALAKCDVPSLIGAIDQCAQMGLEPNTVLGHAYLVPFNTKRKDPQGNERWVNSVQVIIGYKGLIDLARRSGQIVSIAAHEVCEKDHFEMVYGLDEKLEHKPALGERGEIIGFYAVAKLKDGGHSFEFMSRQQIESIRDSSQSAYKDEWKNGKKTGEKVKANSPWWDHFTEMGRKTVIRRLSKYLPLSIEFQTAAALDSMADAGKDQGLDAIDGDYNLVPDDAPIYEDENIDTETGEVTSLEHKQGETLPKNFTKNVEPEPDPVQQTRQQSTSRQERHQQKLDSEQRAPSEKLTPWLDYINGSSAEADIAEAERELNNAQTEQPGQFTESEWAQLNAAIAAKKSPKQQAGQRRRGNIGSIE
ncbi:recombinase RecT [Candidatus Methylospira mobilis]|uniref:recombinase RecT n=1 Tax=Candidatus Methylospira mobilis TaxID=1808979 RepID=UPI001D176998|nr:recombinase RecT [Candidatus Methylospira mobilis]